MHSRLAALIKLREKWSNKLGGGGKQGEFCRLGGRDAVYQDCQRGAPEASATFSIDLKIKGS